ncbi:hypothetical protein F4803DRAFT_576682 [Xylaria telfairii]|nr:hypothetical protein F4803DRAFT_576682 [Xylaria telfairii]
MVKFTSAISILFVSLATAAPVTQSETHAAVARTNGYIGYGSAEDYESVNNKDKRTNGYIGYGSAEDYEAVNSDKDKRTNGSSSVSRPFLPKNKSKTDSDIENETEKDDFNPQISRPRQRSRLHTIALWFGTIVILALSLHSLVILGVSAAVYVHNAALPPCYCGSSIKEALGLDCKYDSLSTSWLPPHCRDDELTALFEHAGPGPDGEWPYHAARNNQSKLYTINEVSYFAERPDLERVVFSTIDWHDKHCFYLLVKKLRGRVKMEYTGFPDSIAHAEHCATSMTKGIPGNKVVIGIFPGFGDPTPEEVRRAEMSSSVGRMIQ